MILGNSFVRAQGLLGANSTYCDTLVPIVLP
jgi:hypothetical protein